MVGQSIERCKQDKMKERFAAMVVGQRKGRPPSFLSWEGQLTAQSSSANDGSEPRIIPESYILSGSASGSHVDDGASVRSEATVSSSYVHADHLQSFQFQKSQGLP